MKENYGILVVDDDAEIADLVEIHLLKNGFKVYKAYNAIDGIKLFRTNNIHCIILDIMMPGIDGIEMCQKIRDTSTVPIIMLSAKSGDMEKIEGLSVGADDYVVKPFNLLELTARVKSQLRRFTKFNAIGSNLSAEKVIELEHLTINRESRMAYAYGKETKLTPTEFDILYLLASNVGKVLSTEEIFEKVWNERMYEANNTVMVHIRRIREKIEMDPRKAQIIKTIWGVGYKIER